MILFRHFCRIVSLGKIQYQNIKMGDFRCVTSKQLEEGIEILLEDIPEFKNAYFFSPVIRRTYSYAEMLRNYPDGRLYQVVIREGDGLTYMSNGIYFEVLTRIKNIMEQL